LALNIEKAHNLRERALEVVRMVRELATLGDDPESRYELELEEPSLVTPGVLLRATRPLLGRRLSPAVEARRRLDRRSPQRSGQRARAPRRTPSRARRRGEGGGQAAGRGRVEESLPQELRRGAD